MPTRPPQHQNKPLHAKRHVRKQTDRQSTRALNTGSKEWRRLRMQVMVRDGFTCAMCGYLHESNEVDHADGDAWNNDPANLRVLCKPCHSKHGKQGNSQPRERDYVIA